MKKAALQAVDHLPASDAATCATCKAITDSPRLNLAKRWYQCPKCYSAEIERESAKHIALLADQVWLRLIAPERHSHGLWIPDSAKREAWEMWNGEVLAVGPGERGKRGGQMTMGVKPGDRVLFYFLGGKTATRWPDKSHLILSESHIQAIYEA